MTNTRYSVDYLPVPNKFTVLKNTVTIDKLFSEESDGELNHYVFFMLSYQKIPSVLWIKDIDCHDAYKWFENRRATEISAEFTRAEYNCETKSSEVKSRNITCKYSLLIHFGIEDSQICILFSPNFREQAEEIVFEFGYVKKQKSKQ